MQKEDFEDLYDLEENLWWFVGMREITSVLLDSEARSPADKVILDAGCGTGGMLEWLNRYKGSGEIIGIDLVRTALDFCRTSGNENLAQASVTHLPFADSTFDLLTSFDVLVQLPCEGSDLLAINEMFRVLRPGGIAFVRVAAYQWLHSGHDKALNTQHRYTLKEITGKMESAGFEILRKTYANSFLLPLIVLQRLLLKRTGLADKGSDVKPLPPNLQWLNNLLTKFLTIEASFLLKNNRKFPAGLSAICVARKPLD